MKTTDCKSSGLPAGNTLASLTTPSRLPSTLFLKPQSILEATVAELRFQTNCPDA
jgi:hypothetical protein